MNLHAYDSAVYYSSDSIENLMLTLCMKMSTVSEWLRANKRTLNISKTKFMILGFPQRLTNLPELCLNLYGENIEQMDSVKYLHVIRDASLTFSQHIEFLLD